MMRSVFQRNCGNGSIDQSY